MEDGYFIEEGRCKRMAEERGIIKRIKRDPLRFDLVDLYDAVGRERKLNLNCAEDSSLFKNLINDSLDNSLTETMIYGRRTEAMFSYVAASLGKCNIIKKEDSGEVLSSNPEIIVPDYKLVLKDGTQLLVEVKNYRQSKPFAEFSVKTSYINKLLTYARLVNSEFYFAIYWSAWELWTLVKPCDFVSEAGKSKLSLDTALKRNNMIVLGDAHIATKSPLTIRFYTDKMHPHKVSDKGEAYFVIGKVEIKCDGSTILSKDEQKIAMALMMYGCWSETSRVWFYEKESQLIDYIEFKFEPEEAKLKQEIDFVGTISTIISRQYCQLTAPNGKVERLTPDISPGLLGIIIPDRYHSETLPLWIMHQTPNFE